MNKIIKLDSLRGFTCLYVTFGHFVLLGVNLPVTVGYLFRFGQEAVMIFFILSGFVIYLAYEKSKDKSLSNYFLKRFRRIYFPYLCAIAISMFLFHFNFSVKELLGNLLMLQDFGFAKPGNLVNTFLGNLPLWSLSYEWVFYIIFPFIFPAIKYSKLRVHFIGLFCIVNLFIYIFFPNHISLVLSYFIIWYTGVEMCDYFICNKSKTNQNILVLYYLLIVFILIINCLLIYCKTKQIQTGVYPYILLRHFLFALICLLSVHYLYPLTNKFISIFKPFSIISPISYAVYILHFPLLLQTNFILPYRLDILVKFGLLFGVSYLIEVVFQPQINKIIRKRS